MVNLKKASSIQRVIKSSLSSNPPKTKFETLLKSPRANQTLKQYLEKNLFRRAIGFFRELLRRNPSAVDSYSLLFVLKACTRQSMIFEGQQVHAAAKKLGFEPIIFLQTCLIDLYSAMGNMDRAHCMFDEIRCKNTICWTSLITAYVDNDMPSKALDLFKKMLMTNLEPDQVTLTIALTACADLGALSMGEWIHSYILRKNVLNNDLCLRNALINMYVKGGDIEAAQTLFYSSSQKDVFTWTSMIVGHALHGQSLEALDLFAKMKQTNRNIKGRKRPVVPNDVTFLGVLMACTHAGMFEEGKRQFKSMMQDYELRPRLPHLGCMVDLLCRAGLLEEAYNFISQMQVQPNAVVWRTLLGACFLHDNIELGSKVRLQLHGLEPAHVGDDVALANIYAAKGLWYQKMMLRDHIRSHRAPGCSSVEVGSEVNEFVAGDSHHPLKAEIYDVLGHLIGLIRAYNCVPDASDVMDY
uniref:Peptidylprolyl isomerase n=1 Tax=Opuntia streptacantha TaxID=393608 RepID=A0A7C9ET99_OPUST